jgi:hypothetical protein
MLAGMRHACDLRSVQIDGDTHKQQASTGLMPVLRVRLYKQSDSEVRFIRTRVTYHTYRKVRTSYSSIHSGHFLISALNLRSSSVALVIPIRIETCILL